MKNFTKLLLLGLLLIPFVIVINSGHAYAATTTVEMPAGAQDSSANKTFDPKEAHIAAGDTVIWHNDDSAGHTVTSGMPGANDSGSLFDSTKDPAGFLIKPNNSWQHTFDKEGSYPYFCQVHPWMTGEIDVGAVPEFPLTAILPLVLAFATVIAVMRIRSGKMFPGV